MGSSSKFQTPKKSATESSRLSAQHYTTPAQPKLQSETPEANEAHRIERRKWLCDLLRGHGKDIGFDKLLAILHLSKARFGQFTNKFGDVFTAVALRCPAYVDRKLTQPRINMTQVLKLLTSDENAVQELRRDLHTELDDKKDGEAALVPYFLQLLGMIQVSRSMQSADDKLLWPSQEYVAAEHQTKPLLGGVHKIDCAVHYENHECVALKSVHIPVGAKSSYQTDTSNDDVFEKLADYAHALWGCQPARAFVPALLLHASHMTLVVFTRDKWYKCDVGDFCYSTKVPTVYEVESLRSSLIKLAFLLTLPPQEFGHFCDVSVGSPTWLKFTPPAAGPTGMTMLREASVVSEDYAGEGVVHLDEDLRIKRKCYPRGRLVFLYRMKFAEKDAVLKLMWTPVNRLPEPAVYQVLHGAGVDRIPKIYDQGILAKDTFGYRIDYMIVEDAGKPPDADITEYASTSGESPCDRAVRLVAQVVKTLIEAKKAGVLHRDVSMGNIAVRGDRASLIDWGYAKLLAGDVNPAVIENLAATWEFDADDVLRNEDKHDPLTGTPMYMSIPVLVRAKTRGVVDDVESALYVLLDVVSRIQPPRPRAEGAEPPVAMDDTKGPSLAHVRACCFAVRDSYLSAFGVREASDRFHQVTDILYNYLFTRSDECISCLLARDPGYKREPDVDVLLESIYTVFPSLRDPATAPLSRGSGSAGLGAGVAALQLKDAGRARQPRAEPSAAPLQLRLDDNDGDDDGDDSPFADAGPSWPSTMPRALAPDNSDNIGSSPTPAGAPRFSAIPRPWTRDYVVGNDNSPLLTRAGVRRPSTMPVPLTYDDNDSLASMDDGARSPSNVAASANSSKRSWDDATAEDADGPAGATLLANAAEPAEELHPAGAIQPPHNQLRRSKRIKNKGKGKAV